VKIVWSPEAADDLEAAVEYLAQDSPAAAAKLGHGIRVVDRLANEPIEGPKHILKTGRRGAGGVCAASADAGPSGQWEEFERLPRMRTRSPV